MIKVPKGRNTGRFNFPSNGTLSVSSTINLKTATMNNFQLLENEKVISYSDDKAITLTNQRIVFKSDNSSLTRSTSIMLEQLSSVEYQHERKAYLTFSTVIFLLVGNFLGIGGTDKCLIFFGLALICYVLYKILQKSNLVFTTACNAIVMPVSGVEKSGIEKFINDVEQAKATRILNLSQNHTKFQNQPVSNTNKSDSLDALEKLGKLRDSGILNEEEFQEQKRRILK